MLKGSYDFWRDWLSPIAVIPLKKYTMSGSTISRLERLTGLKMTEERLGQAIRLHNENLSLLLYTGLVKSISEALDIKVLVPENQRITAALGAAGLPPRLQIN